MLNRIIKLSLRNRLVVLLGAVLLLIAGLYTAKNTDVDVFPSTSTTTLPSSMNI